jgi:hypothetical protein
MVAGTCLFSDSFTLFSYLFCQNNLITAKMNLFSYFCGETRQRSLVPTVCTYYWQSLLLDHIVCSQMLIPSFSLCGVACPSMV